MTDKDYVPDQPLDPPCPTPEELEASEWAKDERERWVALSGALETLDILGDYLKRGQHPKEGLDVPIRIEKRIFWKVLLKCLRVAISTEMAVIIQDLLDAGQEPPAESKEKP